MKHTMTCEIEIDDYWIEYVTSYSDLFGTQYCGYWMYGIEHDSQRGWLSFEHDDNIRLRDVVRHPSYDLAVKAWEEGKELPQGWYRLDKAAAIKAWEHGVRLYGLDWYDKGDAERYDVAIQLALLGEIVYG